MLNFFNQLILDAFARLLWEGRLDIDPGSGNYVLKLEFVVYFVCIDLGNFYQFFVLLVCLKFIDLMNGLKSSVLK